MKYAIVTGSSRGIGRSIGEKLLKEGYYVFFNHSSVGGYVFYNDLEVEYRERFSIVQCDMTKIESILLFYEQVIKITNKLDVIVFNVGLTDRSPFGEIDLEVWNRVFNANLTVPVFFLQKFNELMQEGGVVVFVGSVLGDLPHSFSLSYGVSKSAIHSLVRNLVKFLSVRAIRVNAVAPGFIDTDWQKDKSKEWREGVSRKIALARFGEEKNVSDLVWHVIENGYINGEVYKIDGGYNYF